MTGAQLLASLAKRIAPNGTPSDHFAIAQQMRVALLKALDEPKSAAEVPRG